MKLFEIKTVEATIIKTLIEAMKDILTETVFMIKKDGIYVTDVDTTKTMMVKLHLVSEKFQHYTCNEEINIGIEMISFHKYLKTIGNNDSLTMSMDDCDRSILTLRFDNDKKNCYSTYKMKLSDLDSAIYQINPVTFDTVITLPAPDFQKICRDMKGYSTEITISKANDELQFSCKNDNLSQETIYPIGESGDWFYLKNEEPDEIIWGKFVLEHLLSFTKCTNLCNYVELYLKNDYPLVVKYAVADLGTIRLCLAQKKK